LPSREPAIEPLAGAPLAPLTTLGIGGAARWFIRATSNAHVIAADRWCAARGVPLVVIGGGSNLVVCDAGVDGLVLQIAMSGYELSDERDAVLVRARAGTPWDDVVSAVVERDLAGIECLSGIPGTVGGTPVQNVGAYGQEVADVIEHVTALDRQSQEIVGLRASECGFSYRMSRFKQADPGRFIICGVTLRVSPGRATTTYPDVQRYLERHRITMPTLHDVRTAILETRRAKGMVIDARDPDTRSVGSFFINPVVTVDAHERVASIAGAVPPAFPLGDGEVKVPAAWLIEHVGFARGFADGTVGLSTKHPLAIVNRGGATARDVLRFATRIKRQVDERFGVWLRTEPVFVGFGADPDVEYLQATDQSCRHY
jgi:UDP-N-acetylmuramate dehydrogenase